MSGRRIAGGSFMTSDPKWQGRCLTRARIESVDVETGEVRTLYESKHSSMCGVASYHPTERKIIFIHGPEYPTDDWKYGPSHRRGVIVEEASPGVGIAPDACDLLAPYTPGALRGGSHVHVFSPDGQAVSFTYEDHVLSQFTEENALQQMNLRNVGVSVPVGPVSVRHQHLRNHDGNWFSVLVTRTTANPKPGSDEIKKAFEEGWIGTSGYTRSDGIRQKRALAFQGHVLDEQGRTVSEVFIVDLPDDLTIPGAGPLEGTATLRPCPPKGTAQHD